MQQGRDTGNEHQSYSWLEGDDGDLGLHATSEHAQSWQDYMTQTARENVMGAYAIDSEATQAATVEYAELTPVQTAKLVGARIGELRYAAQIGLEVRDEYFNPKV